MRSTSQKQASKQGRGESVARRVGKFRSSALAAALLLVAMVPAPARDYIDSDDHRRQDATIEFFRLYRAGQLVAPWKDATAGGDFFVYLDNAAHFKGLIFSPVQPTAKDGESLYIASVCAHGDPKHPAYLYLLSWRHRTLRVIRAFHVADGKTQKIDG